MTVDSYTRAPVTPVAGYALSLAALAAAVFLRVLLDPSLMDALPFVTIWGAVAAAVWLVGYRGALLVSVLGYLAADYLFIAPRGSFELGDSSHAIGLIAYAFTAAMIIAIGHAARVAQTQASERQETLRVTLRSIGDAVVTTDLAGRITNLNEVAESLTGWTRADALGEPLEAVFRIVNEVTRERVDNPAARALREGIVVGLANHTLLIRKDGTELAIDDSAAPIRDERGNVTGCVLIFRDVTTHRQSEREKAAALDTARLLASIVEFSEVAIVSKSLDGTIRSWNAAAEHLFGWPASEAIGRHISLVIPAERLAEEDEIIARLKSGQRIEHLETERVRSDGARVWVSLSISPVKDGAGNVIGASKMARDITGQREAEARERQLVALVETSTDFIGISDLEGNPVFVNRAGLALVGLDDLEQARATPVWEFFFHEDRPEIMEKFFPSVLEKGHGEVEIRFRHFKTGEALWMAYKVLILVDHAGRPSGLATVSQDITERKRLEQNLLKLATDLSQADRRKDEFLATLSHELRSPLAPLGNVLEVWKRTEDPETLRRIRDTMERQLGQMVRLVDDLLDLNRITHNRLELRRSRVDLHTVIHQAVEASRPLCDSLGHELRVTLPPGSHWVEADPARLAQVFGNLLNNACKYTNPGGDIALTVERRGDEVFVSVKDSGTGIAADQLERIFDMFTQVGESRASHGGLGIGLTLVKRLLEMHGGSIEAKSEGSNRGSEFVVRLPLLSDAKPAAAVPDIGTAETPQQRRILIVDDNTDSAASLAMLLEIAGNETYTAHDGLEAIEAAESHRPDVVLLDLGLPKLNGHDVCRHLREQPWGKDITLIALTGWGQEEDRRKSRDAGFDGHLVKPVDFQALSELLRSLTAQRPATPSP
jgi:PAS domain S-box-containing protein